MKETWSLDVLYKGYDDPQFEADIKKLDELIAQCLSLIHIYRLSLLLSVQVH